MRIMGLDPGEKRIGVAVSDPMAMTAQPVQVIDHSSPETALQAIKDTCARYEVERVVLGFPRNMDGTEGRKAQQARELAALLQEKLGLEVVLWDERLSTRAVENTLLAADTSRRKRKKVVDKLAAAYILQGYLDWLAKENGKEASD
ncbi:MAG: Holliday junction resolvase RuvX [Syntrophomonadaceae bacterium]|nr:Holliday junction resolvase RuvX [Syntrophomonadaceae bacterium]